MAKEGSYGKVEEVFFGALESRLSEERQKLMETPGMVYYLVILVSKESARGKGLLAKALELA